jgi:hypothetical protein
MRISFKMPVMALILLAFASCVYGQCYPAIGIDSSFRVEYLLGSLTNHLSDPNNLQLRNLITNLTNEVPTSHSYVNTSPLRLDSVPELLALSGVVEASPYPRLSVRLAGSIGVAKRRVQNQQANNLNEIYQETPTSEFNNNILSESQLYQAVQTVSRDNTPDFGSWEVAGLYHFWNAAGYRYSLTAGYRYEKWTLHGGSLHNEYRSSIPFIGMQTAMLFPWWKARFELLGSPFMNRHIESRMGTAFRADGNAGKGGLIEFQMEGSVGLRPSLFLGVNACYSYQEVYGNATAKFGSLSSDYRLYSSESLFRVGFDVNYLF